MQVCSIPSVCPLRFLRLEVLNSFGDVALAVTAFAKERREQVRLDVAVVRTIPPVAQVGVRKCVAKQSDDAFLSVAFGGGCH